MSIKENILLALTSLWSNKMRALLTMLGIIIGIGSVITIFTIGNALNSYISAEMSGMGADNVTLYVSARSSDISGGQIFRQMTQEDMLTDDILEDLKNQFGERIEAFGISVSGGDGTASIGEDYANFTLSGVTADEANINNITMINGRFLLEREIEDEKNVVVISDNFATNYGIEENPIGTQIMLEGANAAPALFTVVGVYEYEQNAMMMGSMSSDEDMTTSAYIPHTVAARLSGAGEGYSSVTIMTNGDDSTGLASEVTNYLNNRQYANNEYFETGSFAMESIIETMQSMLTTLQLAISAVAAISLLVGGIGVMNIMLVSITERTKEIGTRKALGATNFSIRLQFITESAIICILGGIIGIVFGVALGMFASSLLDFPSTPDFISIAIAVGFSFAIGVFFGYYPANKAAKLDPIEALRYE